MKKISEAAPFEKVFEGVESIKKDQLEGKEIEIEAYAILSGTDGNFAVALVKVDEKEYTTTFSEILIPRLEKALVNVGEAEKGNANEHYFAESVGAKLVKKESEKNKNRSYWDLE